MINVKIHELSAAGICVIATAALFAEEHGVNVAKGEALYELCSKIDGSGGGGNWESGGEEVSVSRPCISHAVPRYLWDISQSNIPFPYVFLET